MWKNAPDLSPNQILTIEIGAAVLAIALTAIGQAIVGVGVVAVLAPVLVVLAVVLALRWWWATLGYPHINRDEAAKRMASVDHGPIWRSALQFAVFLALTVIMASAANDHVQNVLAQLAPTFPIVWAMTAFVIGIMRYFARG
jgi:hypothetical protein